MFDYLKYINFKTNKLKMQKCAYKSMNIIMYAKCEKPSKYIIRL